MVCKQCGRELDPISAMMGPVCGACARRNHRRVTHPSGRGRKAERGGWGTRPRRDVDEYQLER